MALTDEGNNGFNVSMPVQPMGYGNGGYSGGWGYPVMPVVGGYGNGCGNGFGGDWSWIIILFLFAAMGGWGNGFGGGWNGNQLGYDFPWLLNGQQGINTNTNAGFNQAATTSALGDLSTAVTTGFGNVQTSLCSGFAGVNATVNGAQNALAQQLYQNEINSLNRSFAEQTANGQGFNSIQSQLAQCCCDNRLATQQLQAVVQSENCADREALSNGIRDLISNQTAGTQRILDQLCQDKIDAKNETIANLRQELLYARGQASQDVQTANLRAGQLAAVDALYARMQNCPVPTMPVYGSQPIFTCNSGCGCGNNVGGFNGTF